MPKPVERSNESKTSAIASPDVPLKRRRKVLIGVAAGSVIAAMGGLCASLVVKSPQQVAADAGPPHASVITALVEQRVLTETVVLRGTVVPGKAIKVSSSATGEGKSVITRSVVKQGQRISAGTVVAEISGRPIIALYGWIPAYRDIRPEAKGTDVRQLQTALRGLGYSVSDAHGFYGPSTQAAVKRLYDDRGYEPTAEAASSELSDPGGVRGAEGKQAAQKIKPEVKVVLRASEVVFVPKFPARVTEMQAELGAEVKGTILTLAAGDLVVRGRLSPVDRQLVRPGQRVRILAEESGLEVVGRVSSIAEFDGGGDSESSGGEGGELRGGGTPVEPGHPIVVKGIRPLSEKCAGQDVRLTIEAASTNGPVLVVPSSAIYANADGSTQVLKVLVGGRHERVSVRTGATGGGFVEVVSDRLARDDRVVVGK